MQGIFVGGIMIKRKTEKFYLVSGDVRLFLADAETNETTSIALMPGQRVSVSPLCAHKFVAISKAQMIEYYSIPFDLSDDIPYDRFKGDDNAQ